MLPPNGGWFNISGYFVLALLLVYPGFFGVMFGLLALTGLCGSAAASRAGKVVGGVAVALALVGVWTMSFHWSVRH